VTYYRWRQEFGGLKIEQVKRLKELELETIGSRSRGSLFIFRSSPAVAFGSLALIRITASGRV
jgi:hypothetical protein